MNAIRDVAQALLNLRRGQKRLINFAVDMVLIALCLYAAYALRYDTLYPFRSYLPGAEWLLVLIPLCSVPILRGLKLHHVKLGAIDASSITRFLYAAIFIASLIMIASFYLRFASPRSVPLIFIALFFVSSTGIRLLALKLINFTVQGDVKQARVLIYGAGAAGGQLASALHLSREVKPIAFVDDDPGLWQAIVAGLRVYPSSEIKRLIREQNVSQIVIAMPSASKKVRAEIVSRLADHSVEVRIIPSYIDLMTGRESLDSLRPVSPEELLGRDSVDLDAPTVTRAYAGRSVMVTGAGGSIGSELCRQLVECRPSKIVLFEQYEYGLYSIQQDLQALIEGTEIALVSRLGSVTDALRVSSVIEDEGVDIILHAAAYKHVPIVEENEIEGARNNVIGTRTVARAAAKAELERFILVSTDKAVRPTNIMGATKRLAELVIQDMQTRSTHTKFAMVRFGNVLGSSGSVIPLFRAQIAKGGPVTVTHKEVTRFFMTISEASRLVLLAGAYAEGGDVFVLDMGKPQKIIDIARHMIRLSGATVREEGSEDGDIEIKVTGLRPGEKLYEELLIDDKSMVATPHAKILRASEDSLSQIELAAILRTMESAISEGDANSLRAVIKTNVAGFQEPQPISNISP